MTQITKYMCTIETKNYPVNSIRPSIQRYSSVRKKFNASEIANCLACYANVTLHKNDGSNVRLTADNFRKVLIGYKNEIINQEERNRLGIKIRKNAEELEKIKTETSEVTKSVEEEIINDTEFLEEFQVDPEDPDIEDFSYIDSDDGVEEPDNVEEETKEE